MQHKWLRRRVVYCFYGLNDHIVLNNTQKTATAIKCNGGRDEKD